MSKNTQQNINNKTALILVTVLATSLVGLAFLLMNKPGIDKDNIELAQSKARTPCVLIDEQRLRSVYGDKAEEQKLSSTALVANSSSETSPVATQSCLYKLAQPNSSGEDGVLVKIHYFKNHDEAQSYASNVIEPTRYWSVGTDAKPGDFDAVATYDVFADGGKGSAQYVAFYTGQGSTITEGRIPCSEKSSAGKDTDACAVQAGKVLDAMKKKLAELETNGDLNPFQEK